MWLLPSRDAVCRPRRRPKAAPRLAVEPLEDRCLLSTLQALSLPPAGAPANGDSFSTAVSADGRFTVFTSTATNLVANQVNANANQNVFLFDRATGAITLVNHVPGTPATTGDGGVGPFVGQPVNSRPPDYLRPVVSGDGSFVAFASFDDDLVPHEAPPPGAHGPLLSVYLYNVATGDVTLVSHAAGDPATVLAEGFHPAISRDGRFVAYGLGAPAAGQPLYSEGAVGLYDRQNDTTVLVTPAGYVSGGTASDPTLSDDGRFVAYEDQGNVYLFDREGGSRLVSHNFAAPTTPADGMSGSAVVSGDGSAVAFVSRANDLVNGQAAGSSTNVFLFQNDAGGSILLLSGAGGSAVNPGNGNSDSPALDADGGFVAFRSDAGDLVAGGTVTGSNVYEADTRGHGLTLISHQAGALTTASGDASEPVIDDDGGLVAYVSTAGGLVPGQIGPAGVPNVFLWVRQAGASLLASGPSGLVSFTADAPADGPLLPRAVSAAYGNFPGFSSAADNLLPGIGGNSVAYINTLFDLGLAGVPPGSEFPGGGGPGAPPLSPAAIHGVVILSLTPLPVTPCTSPGTQNGSPVASVDLSAQLIGQLLAPRYSLAPHEFDNDLFALRLTGLGSPPLLVFVGGVALRAQYTVRIHVNVGLGDQVFARLVTLTPESVAPCLQQPLVDATAALPVLRRKSRHRGSLYQQSLTLRYTGTVALQGPISVVFTGLGRRVHLLHRTGIAQKYVSTGNAYLDLPEVELAPGASVTLRLVFRLPGARAPRYRLRVLAGPGPR
jgi:Tol biopolymer transport system component